MSLPPVLTLDQVKVAIRKDSLTDAEVAEIQTDYIPALTELFNDRCTDTVLAGATWPARVVMAAKDMVRQQWAADHQGNRPQLGGIPDTDTTELGGYVISRRAYGWLQGLLRPGGFA